MSSQDAWSSKVIPARLNFLAIYNPELGVTDETTKDQIVFFYSSVLRERRRRRDRDGVKNEIKPEDENEQMRQIGLAQGMVNFARGFSGGEPVESVETEKHRIVLTEVETGWWILASINSTRLPKARDATIPDVTPAFEYSAREVAPPALLIQQLKRQHDGFMLHHGQSLVELFVRSGRDKFCTLLERYWCRFAQEWDVLLHDNPSLDVYRGIKLAAGGELGIGVGEEDWGSGEREVLEGLARNTEGLVDLVALRFGHEGEVEKSTHDNSGPTSTSAESATPAQWLGSDSPTAAADGVIFTGVETLTRESVRSICNWAEDIKAQGDIAYGVRENPTTIRRRTRRRQIPKLELTASQAEVVQPAPLAPSDPKVPQPIVSGTGEEAADMVKGQAQEADKSKDVYPLADPEVWMKYLTLGYGTSWGGFGRKTQDPPPTAAAETELAKSETVHSSADAIDVKDFAPKQAGISRPPLGRRRTTKRTVSNAHYLIGLRGNLDGSLGSEDEPEDEDTGALSDSSAEESWGNRLVARFVHVQVVVSGTFKSSASSATSASSKNSADTIRSLDSKDWHGRSEADSARETAWKKLRAVVYINQPFIFVLLFEPQTSSLSMPSFFHNLHRQLSPLQKSLLSSTSPEKVASRLKAAQSQIASPQSASAIYDLVYDPVSLTIHTSLPNIPLPGTLAAEGIASTTSSSTASQTGWTRIDALNVHAQILANFAIVHGSRGADLEGSAYGDAQALGGAQERERACKTSRGWWVHWIRVETARQNGGAKGSKEAILVRKSSDAAAGSERGGAGGLGLGRFVPGMPGLPGFGRDASGGGWGPGRLAEGIGVDAKRYVEGLLSLNR